MRNLVYCCLLTLLPATLLGQFVEPTRTTLYMGGNNIANVGTLTASNAVLSGTANTKLSVGAPASGDATLCLLEGYVTNTATRASTGKVRLRFDGNGDFGTYWSAVRGANGGHFSSVYGVRNSGSDVDIMELSSDGVSIGVGIGIKPTHKIHIVGGAYCDGTGDWIAGSDRKYKRDIAPVATNQLGLAAVLQLQPVTYVHTGDVRNVTQIGFVAQDIKDIVPYVVDGDETNGYGIAYSRLVPVLVNAIKELQAQIHELQKWKQDKPR